MLRRMLHCRSKCNSNGSISFLFCIGRLPLDSSPWPRSIVRRLADIERIRGMKDRPAKRVVEDVAEEPLLGESTLVVTIHKVAA